MTSVFVPGPGAPEPGALLKSMAGAGFEVTPARPVARTLLDTFDGRLYAAGIRLEHRTDAGTRLIVRDGGPAPAWTPVDRIPCLANDLPVGPLRARLAPVMDVRALLPAISVAARVTTAVRRNADGKVEVALALHEQLAVASGAPVGVPWAVEITPFEGYPRAARQAAALLSSLGLTRWSDDLLDVVAEEAGVDLRGFVDSPTVTLDRSDGALDAFRRVFANLAATIEANWQGTVADIDPEFLHDLRVAVRRTRSLLSHGRQVLPTAARDHFGAEFRWLGEVTGPARDMDVYLIEWPSYVAPLDDATAEALAPVLDHVARRRQAAHETLVGHLGSSRYRGLMSAWSAWLEGPLPAGPLPKRSLKPLGPVVADRLRQAQDRLLVRGRAIGPSSPAEELHELRKDAKRLRYLLECFGGMLPAVARKPFVQRLKALQENLGEHQDTEVHTAQLTGMAQDLHQAPGITAETLVAIGRLAELFDRRRLAARAEFAGRFNDYDTKSTARTLAELLQAAAPG